MPKIIIDAALSHDPQFFSIRGIQMKSNKRRIINIAKMGMFLPALLIIALICNWPSGQAAQTRDLHIVNNTAVAGQNVNVAIELVSLGDENALGFSLNFNPAVFGNPVGTLGTGGTGATLNVNTAQAASGRIGITLALAAGQSFAAGTRQIIVVTFAVAGNAPAGAASISFGDQPVFREVSDPNANPVTATFTPGTITIQQPNPVPALTSLLPTSGTAGSGGFTLTVNGSNFVNGSTVQWNGSARTTTFVSSAQLTATILPTDLAAAGTNTVTVINAAPGGGTSNGLPFTVNNPAPAITNLSPNAVTVGSAAFTLTINGNNFVSSSSVWWNGSARTTTFVSATQLTAAIPASDLATAGTATVVVMNPAPGGGSSPAATFTINNPSPTISSLNPTGATAGGAAFTLTVNGSGFVAGSTVQWNGSARTTSFVSATQLTAQIPATDIATTGTSNVTVSNPAPGGGTSNAVSFNIGQAQNPIPTITSLSPNAVTAGGAGFTLTVNGTNFINGSTVQWNGSARTTTFVSATQLTVAIPASDIASGDLVTVTVTNPSPGGGTSNGLTFTINNPAPAITSLNPSSATAGGAAFTLTVNGTNFVNGATVRWNGNPRTTTFVSATQLTAQILATDIAAAGTASVIVVTPPPIGGTSNALPFTINGSLAGVSAASFLGAELASESIVAAFGVNLATSVEIANTIPLPTTLAGTKVSVKDSLGTTRLAPLFFVAPTQVNYQMPPGTANGPATVTITSGDGKASVGVQQIATVAPGLFTASATGVGAPAATILRVKADGTQIFEPIATFDAVQNKFVPIPIDLGPAEEQVFVLLFGTGFRFNSGLSSVVVTIGGANAEVLYAGLQSDFVGLDQSNVRIPRSLIGRGEVDLVMTVNGKIANTVRVSIK